jgi:hypothetical protein
MLPGNDIPYPGNPNGYEIDAASGLGLGWDGRAAGYFVDGEGRGVGIICALWGHENWNPAPGQSGLHEWSRLPESGDMLGVMYLPRVASVSST